MHSSNVYRKYWMDMTGDNTVGTNNFNIATNANGSTTDADIIFDLNHEGKLKILDDFEITGTGKKIILNGEYQNKAFTGIISTQINTDKADIITL